MTFPKQRFQPEWRLLRQLQDIVKFGTSRRLEADLLTLCLDILDKEGHTEFVREAHEALDNEIKERESNRERSII